MKVYLEETAFVSIVLACCEVYRHESYGVLLGYRTDDRYIVTTAIPYQSAHRGHSMIYLAASRRKIVEEALNDFPKYKFVGEYHSHPGFRHLKAGIKLSKDDLIDFGCDEIQIVVAINDKRREQPWIQKSDLSLAGTFDEYHINIAAYYNAKSDGAVSPRLANLLCPYAVSLLPREHPAETPKPEAATQLRRGKVAGRSRRGPYSRRNS